MARITEGDITFANSIRPTGNSPLDARDLVNTQTDLTASTTWLIDNPDKMVGLYKGMKVTCFDDGTVWEYRGTTAAEYSNPDNWIRVDGAGSLTIESSDTVYVKMVKTNAGVTYTLTAPKLTFTGDTYVNASVDNHAITLSADVITTKEAFSAQTAAGQLVDGKLLQDIIYENEEVAAAALNDLNTRVISLSGRSYAIASETPTEANVREQYVLKDVSGNTLGTAIKIYKDSHFVRGVMGHSGSTIDPNTGVITDGTLEDNVLCLVYLTYEGLYTLVEVNIDIELYEAAFKSGVTMTNGIVHGVVAGKSEAFLKVDGDGFYTTGIQTAINSAYTSATAYTSNGKYYSKLTDGTNTSTAGTSASTITFTGDTYVGVTVSTDKVTLASDVITGATAFSALTEYGHLVDAKTAVDAINGITSRITNYETVNNYYNFLQTSTAVTSVASVTTGASVVVATISSNQTFSLAGIPTDNREIHILVHNTSLTSDVTITLPNSGSYVSTVGTNFVVPASSWGEINALCSGGVVYVRGA